MGRKKLTIEYVRKYIESFGYKLLSIKYINSKTKMKFMCPKGHIFYMTWANFQSGYRCAECSRLLKSLNIKDLREQVSIIAPGYKLLSTTYTNAQIKLEFMCDEGHKFWMNWGNFQQGKRCFECYRLSRCLDIKDIRKYIKSFGCKLLSTEYVNSAAKLKIECFGSHIFYMSWDGFKRGDRCPECYYNSKWKNYTPEELTKLHNYRAVIIKISDQKYKEYYYKLNSADLRRSKYKYHLDHIYSIIDGFKNNIPVEVISNPNNLQMLWWSDNISKQGNSWQSKKSLYKGYVKYTNEQLK